MTKLRRVYHPYWRWEEVAHNMWGSIDNREQELLRVAAFTGDYRLYGHYMQRVIREWPISCENALTDHALSRKAWLGHAACALAGQWPEDLVRQAWGHLSGEQQFLANGQAAAAIQEWEDAYREGRALHPLVGGPVLPEWLAGRSSGEALREPSRAELQGSGFSHSPQRSLFEEPRVLVGTAIDEPSIAVI